MKCKTITALTLLCLAVLVTPGCLVAVRTAPIDLVYGIPVEYGYRPLLYDGYVVYYTDYGMPYYWHGGIRIGIPAHARARYVEHWHRYRPDYDTWYRHRGHYYRSRRYTDHYGSPSRPAHRPATKWENRSRPGGVAGVSRDRRYNAPRYRDRGDNRPPATRQQ